MQDGADQQGVLLRLVSLPPDDVRKLAEAMSDMPVMSSPNGRQQVFDLVKQRNRAFRPRRSDRDIQEITNFIDACRRDDESFDLLLDVIETYTPRDDPKLHELKDLVDTLLPRALLTKGELREREHSRPAVRLSYS